MEVEATAVAECGGGGSSGGGSLSALETKLRKILKKAEAEGIRLEESFEHFDKDGNGTVDRREFETALRELHFKPTKSELSMLMDRFDSDGNGEIDFDEFIVMMGRAEFEEQRRSRE